MELWLGVDMACSNFEAATWQSAPGRRLGQFGNHLDGFTQLGERVKREQAKQGAETVHLVLEATGPYHKRLCEFAVAQGWQITLVNPAQLRQWAHGIGQRAKTDSQDALLLARFGAERHPAAEQLLSAEMRELDSLLHRRDDLQRMLRQERNRLHALDYDPATPKAVRQSVEQLIETLDAALRQIEEALQQHLRAQPALADHCRRLLTIPGVGPKLVAPLLVLLARWQARSSGAGSAKGLTAFVGLDPVPFHSGSSVHKRPTISRKGDSTMRQRLFMGAFGGVRGNNPLRSFYQRLVNRGKPKRLALVAAARKLLVWAWHVFTSQAPFDSSRHNSQELPA